MFGVPKYSCSGKAQSQSGQVQEKLASTKSTVVASDVLTDFNLVNFCRGGVEVQTVGEEFLFCLENSRER